LALPTLQIRFNSQQTVMTSVGIPAAHSPELCVDIVPPKTSNRAGSRPVLGWAQGWRWRAPAFGG
jgi:hypothetical protein